MPNNFILKLKKYIFYVFLARYFNFLLSLDIFHCARKFQICTYISP